jgi:hypothetical protein
MEEVCETKIIIRKCQLEPEDFSVEIRRFIVKTVDFPELHLVKGATREYQQDNEMGLVWEKVSPVEYKVFLEKNNASTEMLVFSELYNPGWQLVGEEGDMLDNKHLLVNMYANGWLFEKPGEQKFSIIFVPQIALNVGGLISISASILSFAYLGIITWRRKS